MAVSYDARSRRRRGPGQREPEPLPPLPADLPDGWRWARRGVDLQLVGPDGWATHWYLKPERAAAEARRRVLSTPKEKQVTIAAETTIVEAPLSTEERGDLARHRETITRGQQTFIEVGLALADISRRRLYRESHPSLEAWLADEYPDISRRRAYQLMDGAETARELAAPAAGVNHGTQPAPLPTPTSERQVRPLAGLAPDEKRAAYQQATEAAGGKAPTAAQVETAARAVKPPPKPTPAPSAPTPTPAGEVIASAPATPPPPLPTLTPLALALTPLAPQDTGALRQAEALVALLEQAVTLAQVERDRLQRELPDRHYELPDEPVEAAARMFLANPAVKAAASFLAMSAREAG